MKPVTVISNLESALDAQHLCACKNIAVLRAVHGKPGDENIPFDLAEEIITVAPQCSTLNINDLGCSRFDSANDALEHARQLSRSLGTSGYTGEVTITGSQNVTIAILKKSEWKLAIHSIFNADKVNQYRQAVCENNSTLGFKVCAQNVLMALPPCNSIGSASLVDRGANATTTIVCNKDGKRANQTCTFSDSDTKIRTMPCYWGEPSICS
jgi:hypothetical protein